MANILYVADEPAVGQFLDETLSGAGHRAQGSRSVAEALQILTRDGSDLILASQQLPGLTGVEFLSLLRREGYDTPLIILTNGVSDDQADSAIGAGTIGAGAIAAGATGAGATGVGANASGEDEAGATDCVTAPLRAAPLSLAVEQALEFVRLRRENEMLRRDVMQYRSAQQVIGECLQLRRILQTVAMVAPTRATVLLQGESGTGRELLARAIHEQSDRRDEPFIKLDCGALPEAMIESALFGHERGAFAGAARRVEGALERAHGGTLLLSEISAMPLEVQGKLLRVLQDQEFERVGGTSAIRADVRVIVATDASLADLAERGRFRQDLFFRLSVVPIHVPALRERPDDIPMLAHRLAARTAHEMGKEFRGIAPDALRLLQEYDWPGNVRELQHAIERAVVLSVDAVLPAQLFEPLRTARAGAPADAGASPGAHAGRHAGMHAGTPSAAATSAATNAPPVTPPGGIILHTLNVDEAERALIQRALELTRGNRTRTANLLGISVRTLRNKLNGPQRAGVAEH